MTQTQAQVAVDHAAAAAYWHEFGLYVCPLAPETKQTTVTWDLWLDKYSPDYIEAYWNTHPEHLVGAILTNEIIVFDADDPAAVDALEALERAHGITPVQVHRTRKGVHHFFRRAMYTAAKCVSCSTVGHPAGIDIRTARLNGLGTGVGAGIIVLPPSGGRTIISGVDRLADLPEVGQGFIDAVMAHNASTKPRRKLAVALPDNVVPGPQGTQQEVDYLLSHIIPDCSYEDWLAVGMGLKDKMGHVGLDTWDRWSSRGEKYAGPGELERKWSTFTGTGITFATVAHLARENGADLTKFSKGDMGLIIAEGTEDDVAAVLMQDMSEDSLALAMARLYEGQYVFLHGHGAWFRYCSTHWEEDATQTVFNELQRLTRRYNVRRNRGPARYNFVAGVEKKMRTLDAFRRHASEFDTDNYLLNCADGTYDLRTGESYPHNPADCLTKCTGTAPTAEGGEVFRRFLDEITGSDKSLQRFHQVSLGACLSGAVEEHWLLFWYGPTGRNGKNTLSDTVCALLGDYADEIPSSTLMAKRHESHPAEIMVMKGLRLGTSGEIAEGSHWHENRIKELTGNATLKGHYMRQNWVSFHRTHKHLIHGNNQPLMNNVDQAIKARMKIVPFLVSFEGREDPELPAKLLEEKGYILHWLMEGHQRWLANGKRLPICPAVEAESKDYYAAQSTTEAWIAECCLEMTNFDQVGSYWSQAKDLYTSYRMWKEDRGEKPKSQTRFGIEIGKRYPKVMSMGTRYVGLKLK